MYTYTRTFLFLLLYARALHSAHAPENPHRSIGSRAQQHKTGKPKPKKSVKHRSQTPVQFVYEQDPHFHAWRIRSERRVSLNTGTDRVPTITYLQQQVKRYLQAEVEQKEQAHRQEVQAQQMLPHKEEHANTNIIAQEAAPIAMVSLSPSSSFSDDDESLPRPPALALFPSEQKPTPSEPDPTSIVAILARFRARAEVQQPMPSLYTIKDPDKDPEEKDDAFLPDRTAYYPRKKQPAQGLSITTPTLIPHNYRLQPPRIIKVQPAPTRKHSQSSEDEHKAPQTIVAFASPASHQQAQSTMSCVPDCCCLHQ